VLRQTRHVLARRLVRRFCLPWRRVGCVACEGVVRLRLQRLRRVSRWWVVGRAVAFMYLRLVLVRLIRVVVLYALVLRGALVRVALRRRVAVFVLPRVVRSHSCGGRF
jgi:hypothetical protein